MAGVRLPVMEERRIQSSAFSLVSTIPRAFRSTEGADLNLASRIRLRTHAEKMSDDLQKLQELNRALEKTPPKILVAEALKSFFECSASALSQARGKSVGFDGANVVSAMGRAKKVWSLMASARLFVFGIMDYARAYRRADIKSCQDAGYGWMDLDGSSPDVSQQATKLLLKCAEEADKIGFPDPLPFDSIFLAYGRHLSLTPEQGALRVSSNFIERLGIEEILLLGHVLGTVGGSREAYAALHMRGKDVKGNGMIGFIKTYSDEDKEFDGSDYATGRWSQPFNLDPWVLNDLIKAINDKKNVVLERPSLGVRMDHKAVAKRSGMPIPTPMPYYVSHVREGFFEEPVEARTLPKSVEWSHRWDVRGHDCVRVMRGSLPMDQKLMSKLKKRGYAIYVDRDIAAEDMELLRARKMAPRGPEEWVAVKKYRREQYVKGPEGKPYVPAVRVMPGIK